MKACHVPAREQERILQGYMMHNLLKKAGRGGEGDEDDLDGVPNVTEAVSRLPSYIRDEFTAYVRAEAIKRRDAAFCHCSTRFLLSMVASLKQQTLLLTGDCLIKDTQKIPDQVIFVVKGRLEVVSNGKCKRTLQRGDIIGKRWLLSATTESNGDSGEQKTAFSEQTSLRAHTACTLAIGLTDPAEVEDLRFRYEKDFALVRADRERVCETRQKREDSQKKLKRSASKIINLMRTTSSMSTDCGGSETASKTLPSGEEKEESMVES
jgi:hypothetical protein